MSRRKSERIVNLLIMLLSTRVYVTKHQIRSMIEGYQGQSDAAFERMFERDKDDLRAIGVPISTGSNSADSDEENGYRVLRSDFELPPVAFTPEELAVLGAAAQVWQDSIAAQETAEALATLRAAGADPDPQRLLTLKPRIPAEPGFDVVREALLTRREIGFDYRGEPRRVQPWRLLQRRGRWYLLAFDLDRDDTRHFKLSRFTSEVRLTSDADAFAAPRPEQLIGLLDFQGDDQPAVAVVALRAGRGGDLRRVAEPVAWPGPLPQDFEAVRLTGSRPDALVAEVCALGSDAIALDPPALRDAVVAQLQAVATGGAA